MRRTGRTSNNPSLTGVAASLGFRRVELVHVIVGSQGTRAEARGVLHRYPRTVPISMSTAARLAGAGAPLQVDRVTEVGAAAC